MSDQTMHTILIDRRWTGVFQDYFRMKNINGKVIRMITRDHHDILKPYEKLFNKKLGIRDAIIISPLTKSEVNHIIDTYYDNSELLEYQKQQSEEGLKYYYENFGEQQ